MLSVFSSDKSVADTVNLISYSFLWRADGVFIVTQHCIIVSQKGHFFLVVAACRHIVNEAGLD